MAPMNVSASIPAVQGSVAQGNNVIEGMFQQIMQAVQKSVGVGFFSLVTSLQPCSLAY